MKEIPLTQGKFALVDDEDYELLIKNKWRVSIGYATRNQITYSRELKKIVKQHSFLMHRVITNAPKGTQIDHINGNKLDNRKVNLRICTNSQNHANTFLRKDNTSGKKGINWCKQTKSWRARITVNQKEIYLGRFKSLKKASEIYNSAATKYFGEFAKLNKIGDEE